MSSRAEAIRRAMGEEEQAERDDERFRPHPYQVRFFDERLDAAHDRLKAEAELPNPWDLVKDMTALVGEMSVLLEAALDQMRELKRN